MALPEGYTNIEASGKIFKFENIGDYAKGKVVEAGKAKTKFGEQNYWTIEVEEGKFEKVYLTQELLAYRFSVQKNDEIYIEYTGLSEPYEGNRMKLFLVAKKDKGHGGEGVPF